LAFGCAAPVLKHWRGICFYFPLRGFRGLPFGQPPSFAFSRAARAFAADVAFPPSRPNMTAA